MKQQAITVATLGLEDRSRLVLSNAFRKSSNGICQLGDAREAQVALLDLENSSADQLVADFRKLYPNIPLIGLGERKVKFSVQAQVTKPVNLEMLMTKIVELTNPDVAQSNTRITEDKVAKAMQALENKSIAKTLHKRAEQAAPQSAAKRALPGMTDEMCFIPERFLLGSLLAARDQAAANHQTAVLNCWNDRKIVIDPDQQTISTDLTDNQIRSLAIAPIDDNLSSPIHSKFYPAGEVNSELDAVLSTSKLRHFSQEIFMWNLGLLTCRGRIPEEFAVSNRHYLKRWPNLTRVRIPDNAMRILAYWSQQPCTMLDIKEQLDVPFQDIFTVFSAAYAAGLTGEAKRRSDQIMQVIELNAHKRRGLMKSIITRLRGSKSEQISRSA